MISCQELIDNFVQFKQDAQVQKRNIEKLIGIPEQNVLNDIHELEHLIRMDESVHILDQLSEVLPGEQREWDREYIHQKTGEKLWFPLHINYA